MYLDILVGDDDRPLNSLYLDRECLRTAEIRVRRDQCRPAGAPQGIQFDGIRFGDFQIQRSGIRFESQFLRALRLHPVQLREKDGLTRAAHYFAGQGTTRVHDGASS